jgi:hypothetical protein
LRRRGYRKINLSALRLRAKEKRRPLGRRAFAWGRVVANQNGLRLIGWTYGVLTIMVALVAFVVVSAELDTPILADPGIDLTLARLSK